MTTFTAPLADRGLDRPADLGACEKSKPCPNRGVVTVRGRVYCRAHAPAHAAGDVSPQRSEAPRP